MERHGLKQGCQRWGRWLLRWRPNLGEMQGDGFAAPGVLRSARRCGLVAAFAMGLCQLWLGALYVEALGGGWKDAMSVPIGMAVLGFMVFLLAAGASLFPLGWLVYRGNRAATIAVIALWTVAVVLMNGFGWGFLPFGREAVVFAASAAGWVICLYACCTALRAGRKLREAA